MGACCNSGDSATPIARRWFRDGGPGLRAGLRSVITVLFARSPEHNPVIPVSEYHTVIKLAFSIPVFDREEMVIII